MKLIKPVILIDTRVQFYCPPTIIIEIFENQIFCRRLYLNIEADKINKWAPSLLTEINKYLIWLAIQRYFLLLNDSCNERIYKRR
jgi:hypothetical protein